jgi:hypothetical protein
MEERILKVRKLLMASLIAVMATAPSAAMTATQIIPNEDPEWCGNTATNCAPSKPVDSREPLSRATQFDETGFPLLDPAEVNEYCHRKMFGDSQHACLIAVQDAYDNAKFYWRGTIASAHPDDTQIALKQVAQSGRRRDDFLAIIQR